MIILAYTIGVIISWLWQWGRWERKEGQSLWQFWPELGWRHVTSNLGFDVIVFCLWSTGVLDNSFDKIGHLLLQVDKWHWIHGSDEMTIQGALTTGILADTLGDQIVYFMRRKVRSYLKKA